MDNDVRVMEKVFFEAVKDFTLSGKVLK